MLQVGPYSFSFESTLKEEPKNNSEAKKNPSLYNRLSQIIEKYSLKKKYWIEKQR